MSAVPRYRGGPIEPFEGSPTLLAYIAGLIDGEGSIGAKRRCPTAANKMRQNKYDICVDISMTDREPIELVARLCREERLVRRIVRPPWKPIYRFWLENIRAARLLVAIEPYLICKKKRAQTALELFRYRATWVQHKTKVMGVHTFKGGNNVGTSYRVLGASDEFLARCDALWSELLKGAPRSGQGRHFQGKREATL